jgi:hypothetical protein
VAERADDAAARLGNSGEGFRVLRCAGMVTRDAGGFITSWRRPWMASRRRDCDDGEGTRRWRLGFPATAAHGAWAARARIGEV